MESEDVKDIVKKESEDDEWINEEVIIKEEITDEDDAHTHRNEIHERTTNNPKNVGEGPSILRSMLLNPVWIEDKIRKKIQQNETTTKKEAQKKHNNKKSEFLDQSILRNMLLNPIRIEDVKRKKNDRNDKKCNEKPAKVNVLKNDVKQEEDDVIIVNPESVKISNKTEGDIVSKTDGVICNKDDSGICNKNDDVICNKNDGVTCNKNDGVTCNKNSGVVNNKNDMHGDRNVTLKNGSNRNDVIIFSNRNDTITNNFKCKKRSTKSSVSDVPTKRRNKGRMESTYQFGIVRIKPEVAENIAVVNNIDSINKNDTMVNITNCTNDESKVIKNFETDANNKHGNVVDDNKSDLINGGVCEVKSECDTKFDVINVKEEVRDDENRDDSDVVRVSFGKIDDDECKKFKDEKPDIHRFDIVDVKQEEDETFYEDVQDPLAEHGAVELPPLPPHGESDGKKEDYDVYKRWKTEKGTFKCDQCNREIRSVYYFKVHRMKHFSEKIYECDECQKAFADLYTFKKHKELVHSVERPYLCNSCTKAYKTQSELTIHARVHTGEAPYYCGVCNKNFRHSSSFARHKRIHSGIKPHVCEYCDKGFAGLSNLLIHKRTHTGERPYQCDICNKKFSCMDYVNAHKIVHTTGKSHKCNICEKMYKSRATLKQHQINIHGLKDILYEEVVQNSVSEDDEITTDDDFKPDIVDIKIENTE